MKQNEKGFTLIEMMMVIAIIGTLVAISLPSYRAYVYRAKAAELILLIDKINTVLSGLQSEDGSTIGTPLVITEWHKPQMSDAALRVCVINLHTCINERAVPGLNKSELNRFKQLGFEVVVSSGTVLTRQPGQYKIGLSIDYGLNSDPKLREEAKQIVLATEHVMKPATYKTTVSRDGSVGLYFQLGSK